MKSSSNKDQKLLQLKITFDRMMQLVPVQCKIVPYGYYSPCPAGNYSNIGSSNCTLCPVGTYTVCNARGSCLYCPDGQSTFRSATNDKSI